MTARRPAFPSASRRRFTGRYGKEEETGDIDMSIYGAHRLTTYPPNKTSINRVRLFRVRRRIDEFRAIHPCK